MILIKLRWIVVLYVSSSILLGASSILLGVSLLVKRMEMVLEDVILPFHEYDNDV